MSRRRPFIWALAWISRVVMGVSLVLGQAQTQTHPSSQGPGYDRRAEVTVEGTVEAMIERTTSKGLAGLFLELRAEKESLDVYVGPQWFLSANGIRIAVGDRVQITGAKSNDSGEEVILAREIQHEENRLVLRDKRGAPKWSARGGLSY